MTPKEKVALVDLLNAHTNKIISFIGKDPRLQYWESENVDRRLDAAEREFLAEPEEVVES